MKQNAKDVLSSLREMIREDKAKFLPGFFQVYPGGYGEGDMFLGVVVPDQRKIAKRYHGLSRSELKKLLRSPWHECRLTGLVILVTQFERANKGRQTDPQLAREIVEFYLDNLEAANNWDLVDTSAPKILGRWLLEHPKERKILDQLAGSEIIWERRVAIVVTMPLIHAGEFKEILKLSKRLMKDDHDLMHKAIGWMLREVWKRDPATLIDFLDKHVKQMPRTMLRYAIEKMTKSERQQWLQR